MFLFAWREYRARDVNEGNRKITRSIGRREKKRERKGETREEKWSTESTHALPVATGAGGCIRDVGRIRGWTDSTRRQGWSRGLTRGRSRNGPYDAHVAPTYPVLGRMLPGGLRALRQPTTSGASRHHRRSARSCCLMGHRPAAVQRRALRSEIQISEVRSMPQTLAGEGWGGLLSTCQ